MEKIYSDDISEYYLIDLTDTKYVKDLEEYEYDDITQYIENLFITQFIELRDKSYDNEVYYNLVNYKSHVFLLLGVLVAFTSDGENHIYSTMVSPSLYGILDAFITEYEFYHMSAFLFIADSLDIVIMITPILQGKETLSFLFKYKNIFLLIFGLSKTVNSKYILFLLAKLNEFGTCMKINPIFVLHCIEFYEKYEILMLPYAIKKLAYIMRLI